MHSIAKTGNGFWELIERIFALRTHRTISFQKNGFDLKTETLLVNNP
jgi:hypothetical protein